MTPGLVKSVWSADGIRGRSVGLDLEDCPLSQILLTRAEAKRLAFALLAAAAQHDGPHFEIVDPIGFDGDLPEGGGSR